MAKISFSFENGNKILQTEDALNILINEKEGELPTLEVSFPIEFMTEAEEATNITMLMDNTLIFCGRVEEIIIDSNSLVVIAKGIAIQKVPKLEEKYPRFVESFIAENSDFLLDLDSPQPTKTGDTARISLTEASNPMDIEHLILEDSLIIEKSNSNVIKTLNLELSASWIKGIDGNLDVSSKIAGKFKDGKISTLTPYKLIDSWPLFGDRLSGCANTRQTKYSVSHSRLTQDMSMSTKTRDIQISDSIPKFALKREYFDNKLILSWSFDQYVTENLSAKIVNNSAKGGCSKTIHLNLGNIQEHMEDEHEESFFSTNNIGQQLQEYIFRMLGNYIVLSMRNVKISFSIPYMDDPEAISALGPNRWLNVNGYIAKITNVEYKISDNEKIIKIKAAAFEKKLDRIKEQLKPPTIESATAEALRYEDIIQDISIANDADTQFRKLVEYIDDLKSFNKINKNNYKSLISKFLQENQTKINIMAKPLKTKHVEKRQITITEPIGFL